jgi:uncharacterized membrane protein YGL010W
MHFSIVQDFFSENTFLSSTNRLHTCTIAERKFYVNYSALFGIAFLCIYRMLLWKKSSLFSTPHNQRFMMRENFAFFSISFLLRPRQLLMLLAVAFILS